MATLADQPPKMPAAGTGKQTTQTKDGFWDTPLPEMLRTLQTSPQGLSGAEAQQRLRQYGPNSLARESPFAGILAFFRIFADPLVLILLFASVISFVTGDQIDALIIIVIVLLSVLLNFFQEFQARHAVEKLRNQVATTAEVIRDGTAQELPVSALVPGDIIKLNAGDLVPADARLIEVKDLHVREAALTGESLPVEKTGDDLSGGVHTITDAENSVFMGTAVQTGIATAVVVHTGTATEFGDIAARLTQKPPETEFGRGIRSFGSLITRVIFILVVFVFLVNILFHSQIINLLTQGHPVDPNQIVAVRRNLLDSFIFAIALAVGLTPELLPMIITITLAQGAKSMARKKVITKQLASIENFGSMEILCSDKTGTLTAGEITLQQHVTVTGEDDENVLQMIYLNSYFEAGIRNPMDDAILKHEHPTIDEFTKIDEVPFDFYRKRLSVVVQHGDERVMITKGAAENVFDICTQVRLAGTAEPFDAAHKKTAMDTYLAMSADGYRVLGVATRLVPAQKTYSVSDEQGMTLIGFAAFLDPPKPGVHECLEALKADGISVIIMTGDNQYVTKKIAHDVGLNTDIIITGAQMDAMADAALAQQAEQGAIFAHVSPEQKNRVITALKARGRVVGFMGDGINDAPSMHAADIGISVMNGVDVAKEAANIILLENDLGVLHDGVIQGRKSFANIMKYIVMGTSSNFGNMFSMAAASLVLPFLPMLPTQILLNNLLYDASQISIPTDNVDPTLLHRPKRWDISFIRQFMVIIGPISSIYDFLTFAVLLWGFGAYTNPALFHTGWFVESLATQTLVIFVIRTSGNPLQSRPSPQLLGAVLTAVAIAVVLPFSPFAIWLGFTPLPAALLGVIAVLTATYLLLVQGVKVWFYKKHALM